MRASYGLLHALWRSCKSRPEALPVPPQCQGENDGATAAPSWLTFPGLCIECATSAHDYRSSTVYCLDCCRRLCGPHTAAHTGLGHRVEGHTAPVPTALWQDPGKLTSPVAAKQSYHSASVLKRARDVTDEGYVPRDSESWRRIRVVYCFASENLLQ